MKKLLTFTFLFLTISILIATSYHTISIDGENDFTSDETFSTSSSGYLTYVTWDAEKLFFGFSGSDIGTYESDKKWIVIYIDTDSPLNPNSGNGTKQAISFNTQNWYLPFKADYMIQIRTDEGSNLLKYYNGTSWEEVSPNNLTIYDNDISNFLELSVPKASIGNPQKIYVLSYFINESSLGEWTYASFPDNSLRNGDGYKNPGYFDHWYGFELVNGISPNAAINYDNREFLKWDVRLGASIPSAGLNDNNNYAGVALNATDGYDPDVDLQKPPAPPSNFIYLSFPHEDWDNYLGTDYYRDIKQNQPLDTSTISWDFSVKTDRANSTIFISVSEFTDVPANYDIYINDLTNGVLHNVRTNGDYSYNSGSGGTRNFKLTIGKFVPNLSTITTLSFGNVKLEYDSSKTFTVSNTGLDTLIISNLSITGNFTLENGTTPIKIPAGDSRNLTVKFTPLSLGNNTGTLTINSNDPDSPVYEISLNGTGIKPTLTKTFLPGWNLMGIPLYPPNPKKDSVFGPYSNNYLLFKYENGSYIPSDSILLGNGYWLGIQDTLNLSLTGMPVLSDTLIKLNLGWNVISHLYLKDLRKSSLMIKRGSELISLDSAVQRGWIQPNLIGYSKSNNSYFIVDTLDQFNGYWFATLIDSLELKFVKSQTIGPLPKIKNQFIDERNWIVFLSGKNSISHDNLFYFGVNDRATSGFDNTFDHAKPPRLPNDSAIELYFLRNDWHPSFTKYFSDIRKYQPNQPLIWQFEFSSKKIENSLLQWHNLNEIFPPDYLENVYFLLVDLTNNRTIDMKQTQQYQFYHNGNITQFAIKVGRLTSLNDNLPALRYSLDQNFPNPFNPSTRIRYSIVHKNNVKLSVHNLLGELVAILVNKIQEPGTYEVEFNANQYGLVSGIYFYKIKSGDFTDTKKLILLK